MLEVQEGLQVERELELIAMDLRLALSALGEVVGETTTENLLDTIFNQFLPRKIIGIISAQAACPLAGEELSPPFRSELGSRSSCPWGRQEPWQEILLPPAV